MASRPQFQSAWAAFSSVYGDGSLQHVADHLGGRVRSNIESGVFENACAIRMSYALNHSGFRIAGAHGATVSADDNNVYLYRLRDLDRVLRTHFGSPDVDGAATAMSITGKRGILLFTVSAWNNATGHATLWDGSICADRCYFPESSHVTF